MRQELVKTETHVYARVRPAKKFAVDMADERQVQLAVAPSVRKLIGGRRDSGKCGRGLRLQEAKALGKLARNEIAQTPVVDEHDELHMAGGCCGRNAERHIVSHDRNLGLKIDALLLACERRIIAGAQKRIRASLIHERIGAKRGGHFSTARLAHELDMMQVGAAVEPLIGSRQRCCAGARIEGMRAHGICQLKLDSRRTQPWLSRIPAVERGLQRRGDVRHRHITPKRAIDDDQLAVAVRALQARKLHLSVRQLSTYPAHSTALADAPMSSGSRASIITATSSVALFDCLSRFASALGCGPCVKPHGCSVTMPG